MSRGFKSWTILFCDDLFFHEKVYQNVDESPLLRQHRYSRSSFVRCLQPRGIRRRVDNSPQASDPAVDRSEYLISPHELGIKRGKREKPIRHSRKMHSP